MESILGNKFKPSKDYGVCIVHRGKQLCPIDEIFLIFSKKNAHNVLLFFNQKEKY